MNTAHINHYLLKILDLMENPKLWGYLTAAGIFISQYVFSQWIFAFGFFCIFLMDTITGMYIAWRQGNYNGKIFRDKLMDKCMVYFTIIISFSIATKVTLEGSDWNFIEYMNVPFYTLFIGVELRSVIFNWYRFKEWPWLGTLIKMIDKDKKEQIDQEEEQKREDINNGD